MYFVSISGLYFVPYQYCFTKVHPPQSVVMSQYTSNHVPLFSGYIVYIQSTNVESFNNKSEHDLGN
ncbi:hypothetical protein HOG21_00635, partial [bacterium]|nr:hypothetical protein [bacterium]